MATKKHMNYDSDEAMTLRGSKIPKAIMASEGTRFDKGKTTAVISPDNFGNCSSISVINPEVKYSSASNRNTHSVAIGKFSKAQLNCAA